MKGFSLLETLIAWGILIFALFAIIPLQLITMRQIQQNYWHCIAIVQLHNMLERLRANASNIDRLREYAQWNDNNKQLLPSGVGNYQCNRNVCQINLEWRNRRALYHETLKSSL